MTILRDQAEKILRSALEAKIGLQILVTEDSPGTITPALRVEQILYRFRREIGDVELMVLQIRPCPKDPDHRLWIHKRSDQDFDPESLSPDPSDSVENLLAENL